MGVADVDEIVVLQYAVHASFDSFSIAKVERSRNGGRYGKVLTRFQPFQIQLCTKQFEMLF